MERVEIDWVPRCDDGSLPTNSALSEWSSNLLKAMDIYGRPMKLNPTETRHELAQAGFKDIHETAIRAYYNNWPDDPHNQNVGNWFHIALSKGLTALSYAPMMEKLGMSKEEVERLCSRAQEEIRYRSCRAYCIL